MAFPNDVTLREVTFGPAFDLTSGAPLAMKVTFTPSRSMVRGAPTGAPGVAREYSVTTEEGMEGSISIPVTDQAGWFDGNGNAISTDAGGNTHSYRVKVAYLNEQGREVGSQPAAKSIALPAGDLSPVDLDALIPVTTTGGVTVSVPDSWSADVAAAAASAAAAEAALSDADTLVAGNITDTGSATRASLNATIATVGLGDLIEPNFVNPRQSHGAVADARIRNSVAMTSGSNVVTTTGDGFSIVTPGMFFAVVGAGAAGAVLTTTVVSKTDSNTVVLAATASTTVSGVACQFGTDNTAALQAALDAGVPVVLSGGSYLTGPLTLPHEASIEGASGGIIFNKWGRAPRLMLKAMSNDSLLKGMAGTYGSQGVVLRQFEVEGAKAFQTVAAALVNQPDLAGAAQEVHWVIDSLLVTNSKGDGLYLGKNTRGSQVTRSWFYTNDGNGIRAKSSDCQITNNFIGSNVGNGIRLNDGAWDTQIIANNIWQNAIAIVLEGVKLTWIVNNFIDTNQLAGIGVDSCSATVIDSNIFGGNSAASHGARPSIELGNNIDRPVITGNSFPRRPDGASTPLPSYCVFSGSGGTGVDGLFIDSNNQWEGGLSSVNGFNNISPDAGRPRLPASTTAAPLFSGKYYGGLASNTTTAINAEGSMRGSRIVVGRSTTLTRIGVEVTVVGTAGAVVRLGIYRLDPNTGAPTLLVDAGTIDGTVLGFQEITISQAVSYGDQLLLTATPQGGAGTRPTLRMNSGGDAFFGDSTATTVSSVVLAGASVSGVTGALPSTPTLGVASTGTAPRVLVKAA